MGYDVSFHPIREDEIKKWYWDPIADDSVTVESVQEMIAKTISDSDFIDDWLELLDDGQHYESDIPFDCCHGMAIARIQGFVRNYYYIRGGVFSQLLDKPFYASCCHTWQEIFGGKFRRPVWNCIQDNYCSGAYITAEGVRRILAAIKAHNIEVCQDLLTVFGDENLPVFIKALEASAEIDAGLLEATEIIEPNPIDLRQTQCMTNLRNCDFDGIVVYHNIAMQQLGMLK